VSVDTKVLLGLLHEVKGILRVDDHILGELVAVIRVNIDIDEQSAQLARSDSAQFVNADDLADLESLPLFEAEISLVLFAFMSSEAMRV
jgi:hypothetical protein